MRYIIAVVVALSVSSPLAAQSRRPLTPDDIFELKSVGDPRISPDGAWVAYTVSTMDRKEDNSDTDVYMGLTAGWGDIYQFSLDGNYVEMDGAGDGFYVVRSKADAEDVVLESNERDNSAYAYIHVVGDTITVLERGYGTSPWDRRKRKADDLLPANAPAGATACPRPVPTACI